MIMFFLELLESGFEFDHVESMIGVEIGDFEVLGHLLLLVKDLLYISPAVDGLTHLLHLLDYSKSYIISQTRQHCLPLLQFADPIWRQVPAKGHARVDYALLPDY